MGLIAAVGAWVVSNLPTFVKVTKRVAAFVHNSAEVVDAFLEGRAFVNIRIDDPPQKAITQIARPNVDFWGNKQDRDNFSSLSTIIEERKKEFDHHSLQDATEHKKLKLQVDILELIIAAQHLERFSNNIRIHSANLETHYQTIRNMTGILDDVNHQRVAIKTLLRTVNHLINATGSSNVVEKISGIDVEIKEGSISIHDSYKAFEATRALIIEEIQGYLGYLASQRTAIERVRASAMDIPVVNVKIDQWLNKTVLPAIATAEEGAKSLGSDLTCIKMIESYREY